MTSKTVLLHIGTPKTGTTSIQEYLSGAEMAGTLRPYRYPLFRGDRDHNRLTTLYLTHEDQPAPRLVEFPRDDERYRRTCSRYREFLFEALRSSGGAILSGEALGNSFAPPTVVHLRRDLESSGFREFHIVLSIRDPADFYLSRTQSILKLPLQRGPLVADPVSFRYRFRRIAENWEQVFPGRVIVRCYPRGTRHDVVEDFSELLRNRLGIKLPRASIRLNTTVSAEAMVVLQNYRQSVGTDEGGRRIPGLRRLVTFLMRSGRHFPQTKPTLNAAVAELIRANHREDAEFISARYGVDLGLAHADGGSPLDARSSWRVEDIVEAFDPAIVRRLHDEFHRLRFRLHLLDIAQRGYRAIPSALRPVRLDAWLRARFKG